MDTRTCIATAYAAISIANLLPYIPQIRLLLRTPQAALHTLPFAWGVWSASSLVEFLYLWPVEGALVAKTMAAVHAVACLAVLMVVLVQRERAHKTLGAPVAGPLPSPALVRPSPVRTVPATAARPRSEQQDERTPIAA